MDNMLRTLVVDDSDSDALRLSQELQRGGYEPMVERVETAAGLCAALSRQTWDVVLSDYILAQFSGPEALSLLHESGLDLPFILVSHAVNGTAMAAAFKAGAQDFISKRDLARLVPAVQRERREAENREARRRAEAALQAAEARHKSTMDAMLEGAQIIGFDWRYLYVNDTVAAQGHKAKDELIGRTMEEAYPGIKQSELFGVLRRCMAERAAERLENEFTYLDGSTGWFELSIQPVPEGLFILSQDITYRKQTEAALRAGERRFRAMIENSADAIALLGADGMVIYDSPAAPGMLGYGPDDWLGRSAFELLHPDDVAPVRRLLGELSQQPGARDCASFRLQHKGGTWRWIEAVASNLLDEPAVRAIVVNYRDVTERKAAEQALKASEQRFRALIENAPDGITVVGADGRVVYTSPSISRILAYSPDEALGQNAADFVHPDDLPALLGRLAEIAKDPGANATVEYRFRHRDGSWRWLQSRVTNLLRDPAVGAVIFNYRDVTERKQAGEALQASEQRLRNILEASQDGTVLADEQGQIVEWSPGMAAITGVPSEAALGQALWDVQFRFTVPEHRTAENFARQKAILERIFRSGALPKGGAVMEREMERPDGARRILQSVLFTVPTPNGIMVGSTSRDVTASRQAEAQIQRQLDRLAALRSIDVAITSSLDLNLTLGVVLEAVVTQLQVDAADIMLLDPVGQVLRFAAGRGFRIPALLHTQQRLGEGHAGRAALERQLVLEPELRQAAQPMRRTGLLVGEGFVSYAAAPLLAKGEVKGVLEIFHRTRLAPEPEWLSFVEALAGQAAIAVDNANLFEGLQRSNGELIQAYDATIEGWSAALDLRDRETEGHSQRVTEMSLQLARALGLPEAELVHMRRGALLHDIGKMGVPDHILLKPGPLSEEEWEIMRQHPVHAFEMLSPIRYLRPALDIPYFHHEKWDGSGYPRGLQGELIPLAARIFAVVDVYDALRSDRPYRPAWREAKVLEHIRQQAGTHFDPRVVELFLQQDWRGAF